MNSEFRYRGYWIPFPKPVPAVVGTAWDDGDLRTICISSEWLPYVLGALAVLCRRETYYGDQADIEFSVEQANHILAGWRDECPMTIQFQQTTPCLLEYSLDGGTTWTGMYNGQLCINENIADGTLAAGTTANPSSPVTPGGCTEYHIQVSEQTDFVLPTTVSAGDVITVSDVSGAWADGWLGNFWYCYDGSVFLLGVCISGSNPAKSGDPLTTGQHMQLVCKIGSTYYDALGGAITVPSGVSNELISFLPNNGSARSGGTGVVKALVTVCANAHWCYDFDFTTGDGGFTNYDWTASYVAGVGWQNTGTAKAIYIHKLFPSANFTKVEFTVVISGSTSPGWRGFAVGAFPASGSYINAVDNTLGNGTYTVTANGNVSAVEIKSAMQTDGTLTLTKIHVEGNLGSPFGASNC